jgi:hypothetical protein
VADHGPSDGISEAVPDRGIAFEEKVEKLAKKLMHGGDGNDVTDIDAARRSARRMIEESEARTLQATDLDPDDPDVIRRSSSETAASGDTGNMRRVTEGE